MKIKKVSNTKTNLETIKKSPKQQRRSKKSSRSLKISANNNVEDFTDEKKLQEESEDVHGQEEVPICKRQKLKETEVPVHKKQRLKEKKANKIKMKQKNLKISVHNKLQDFTDEKTLKESEDVHRQEEVPVCKQQKLKEREVPFNKKQRLKEKKTNKIKMKQKNLKNTVHKKMQDFTDEKKQDESEDVNGQEKVSVCKQKKLKEREVPVNKKQRLKEKKRNKIKMKQQKLKKVKDKEFHESYLEYSDEDATKDHSEIEAQNSEISEKKTNFENIDKDATEDHCEDEAQDVESAEGKSIRQKKFEKGKLVQRSEASLNISEFNLSEIGKEKVNLDELLKTLKKTKSQIAVKKQLKDAAKLKKLAEPLSKAQMEKIKRTIGYEKVCDEVAKWDSIVRSNRVADQIVFPLKKPFILDPTDKIAESFVSKTPLEEEVSRMLSNSENVLVKERSLTVAEEKALQAMSLKEAKLRHGELMKHRALLSYKEAKARRQNKIKSKKYHRLLKKEKLKSAVKEFEALQKTDPEAAFEKFVETDKLRMLERMTLKHRNTGKWAKQQKLRAKYNPESRISLKEDVNLGRKLREKLKDVDISVPAEPTVTDAPTDPTDEDLIFDSRHDVTLTEDKTSHSGFIANEINGANYRHDIDPDDIPKEKHVDFAETSTEDTTGKLLLHVPETSNTQRNKLTEQQKEKGKSVPIEQDIGFSTEVTFLDSMVPDDITAGDEDIDDVEADVMNIRQAFADEGLIAEFREEKKAADEANKPQGIDLFLPGWGSWGGPSIKASDRKRKSFYIEPAVPTKKKEYLNSVIITEDTDKKAAAHQVSTLPFPFTKAHQFESYIRQPIGNTWNPETSYHKLILPKVVTKLGKIINPLDADDVILEKKEDKLPPKGFRKKALRQVTAF